MHSINQPGSTFYYSYRLLEPDDLTVLIALFELQHELKSLTRIKSEKSVAYTKLHWWNEEVARLHQQQPRHPVTKTILTTSFSTDHINLLENLLVAAKMDLDYDSYPDYLTLCKYLDLSSGSLMQAASIVCGNNNEQFGTYLGRATAMTRYLQNLGNDLHNGMLYLPISDLSSQELTAEELSAHAIPDKTRAVCEQYAQRAADNFTKAYASLNSEDLNQQLPNLVFGKLHQKLLLQLRKNRFEDLGKDLRLSPIKKLLLSIFANPKKIVRQ